MKIVQVIPEGKNSAVAVSGVNTIFRNAQQAGLSIDYNIASAQSSKNVLIDGFNLRL